MIFAEKYLAAADGEVPRGTSPSAARSIRGDNYPDTGGDVDALEKLVEEAMTHESLDDFVTVLEEAKENTFTLIESIYEGEFSPGQNGLAGRLYREFDIAVRKMQGTSDSALPWVIIRSLAIELNNEHDSERPALTILETITINYDLAPPEEALELIEKDLRTIRGNVALIEFDNAIRHNRLKDALKFIDRVIDGTDKLEQIAQYQSIKDSIKKKINAQRIKWVVGSIFAVVIVVGIVIEVSVVRTPNSTSTYSNKYSKYNKQVPKNSSETIRGSITANTNNSHKEVKPPTESGRRLSIEEARYCLYQKERLAAMRPLIATKYELSQFNQLVDEFNACCSKSLYLERDIVKLRSELEGSRQHLKEGAAKIVNSWRLNPNSFLDAVKIQRRLKELGYYNGTIDGIWGSESRSALRTAKRNNGFPDNSIWDIQTQEALFARTD
jgi:hypothetical protein